ncbi:phage protease [Burkholderia arboris]|uniref:phage protease n=1 Tax=Burkholderia arboris TaxID=488730 RepID=UPI00210902FA|nr:phage protease [Burkholderia arboris]UTV56163.1 phage protease [Burkholderia arboris]
MDKTTSPQAKGLANWIEVFRAGNHVAADGRTISFSRADLDQMVANHANGAAPAVLGHPKHNDPAYAWTAELKRDGDSLFARFEDINPQFEAGVESGAYRNRSVAVFQDQQRGWRVRHVGWLGAVPPAIDGLRPVEFADGHETFEFAAPGVIHLGWGLESAARLFRGVREWLIGDRGQDVADAVVPNWQIDSIEEAARAANDVEPVVAASTFSHSGGNDVTITQQDLDRARQEGITQGVTQGREAATAEFSQRISDADARAASIEGERRAERISTQIAGWVKEGRVLPAEQSGLAEFMAQIDTAGQSFEFSANNGTVKKTPAQWFAEFMSARTPVVKLGQRDIGDAQTDATDPQAIANAATEFMKNQSDKGITVSYADAVLHVSKG